MLTYITLPTSAPTDVFAAVGTLTSDLWVIIAVAIGVPLAFYIIRRVIGLMPKAGGSRRA
jgi:hypothetical protein